MSAENVEIMRVLLEAFNRRDAAGIQACLASDAEIFPIRAAFEDTRYSGPDAGAQWIAGIDEAWTDLTVDVHELRDLGDRVLTIAGIRARGPRSGVDLDIDAASVAQFRGGRVSNLRVHASRHDALKAAGLSE